MHLFGCMYASSTISFATSELFILASTALSTRLPETRVAATSFTLESVGTFTQSYTCLFVGLNRFGLIRAVLTPQWIPAREMFAPLIHCLSVHGPSLHEEPGYVTDVQQPFLGKRSGCLFPLCHCVKAYL
ncbi:hypothetical protein JAAARDRAFT_595888 [Jaapia argillacea MUCL 33604]|uniref:Uncharacterized protein n=1 Tax=Jaapia argillacea MUCL 33604 TaxID=933084 RepID=A0A067PZI1_9AGAM|nr:hypothetical protein JAAARDRAFT_595888 [Jaapia argillacea MUCL 33604]